MRRRVLELDGLRGVAILLVVFAHAVQGVSPSYSGLAPKLGSLGGFIGVQLFFVLSGYLITRILVSEREQTGAVRLRAFYWRRFRRLGPSLLVVAAVLVAVDPVGVVRAVTYTSNIQGGSHGGGWLGHAWSLAVEEQFYLVWPALLVVAGQHARLVAVTGIVGTVALQQTVGWSDGAVYTGLRWDALLAGCLLALVPFVARRWWFTIGAAAVLAYEVGVFGGSVERIDYPIGTLVCVLVVASATTVPWLAASWLRHLGHISYALYLWHVVVMRIDVSMLAALPVSFVLAEVTWLLVDRRAQGQPTVQTSNAICPADSPALSGSSRSSTR